MIRSACILAAFLAGSPDDGPGPIRAIDASYRAAVARIYSAKTEGEEKVATEAFQALRSTLVDRAWAVAREHPGGPEAVDALTWVVQNGRGNSEPRLRAMETLRLESIASDRLGEACRWAPNSVGKESLEAERLLREAIAKNPHPEVRGRANFGLAELLEGRADMIGDLDKRLPTLTGWFGEATVKRLTERTADDLLDESGSLYELVARTDPGTEHSRTGKTLGAVAEGRAHRLRDLAVGRVFPEIEGVDVDGKPLKLSDHRGQVIVLSFTGAWCPSCHNLYPQERELLKKYKGRPFAVLSVDTDEDKAPFRKEIESGEVTWPCWWDGGVGGPITVRCGIYYFPTVFVIDRKGVVRFKDIQGPELDEAVEALLKEGG